MLACGRFLSVFVVVRSRALFPRNPLDFELTVRLTQMYIELLGDPEAFQVYD